jgi:SAM-dependent methyltransferase
MAPLDYFKRRFCMSPRRLALLLGAADSGFAAELVRSGVAQRVIGIDESEERVERESERVPEDLRDVIVLGVEGPGSYPPELRYDLIVSRDVLRRIGDLPAWCRAIAGLLDDEGVLWVDDYIGPHRSHLADRVLRTVPGALPAPEREGPAGIAAVLEAHFEPLHVANYGGALFDRYAGSDDAQLRTLMEVDFVLTDLGALAPDYLWAVYGRPDPEAEPVPAHAEPVAAAAREALPLPPPNLRFMKEDDARFRAVGDEIVQDMEELCGLRPDSIVLDVGSGYGRVAHALWRHGFVGRYRGLEILPDHARWCAETLTPASGGMLVFEHLDIVNARYNPRGTIKAEELTFSDPDGGTDVAVLASVFTHMFPAEIERYMSELARVLRPSGRVLATFFMLDETWREAALSGRTAIPMPYRLGDDARYHNADDPLHAIGYAPAWIRRAAADAGLRVQATRLGHWASRPAVGPGYQDTVVLARA